MIIKYNILKRATFASILVLAISGSAVGEDNFDPSKLSPNQLTAKHFDHLKLQGNNNGKLEYEEFVRFQLRKQSPSFNELDTDGNFNVTWKEKVKWAEEFGMDYFPDKSEISFEQANTTLPPPRSPEAFSIGNKKKGLGQLRLSNNYTDLLKGMKKSDPASFGYYYNNLDNEATWAVEGTLGLIRNIYEPKADSKIGKYYLDPIMFIPAVTINRVTGTGDGTVSEVDAMVFRAGLTLGLRDDSDDSDGTSGAIFDHQLFSANYRAAGATDGDDFKSALEIIWKPMRNRKGELLSLNGPYRAFSADSDTDPEKQPFLYRLVFEGKLEAGESINDSNANTFIKLGPTLGLYLKPNFVPRLELFAKYSYFWEVADNSDDFEYLETGARIALDSLKQVFVEVKYRDGQVPSRYTEINLWQVALSVRF